MGIMMSPELIPKANRQAKDSASEGSGSNSGSGRGKHERADDQDDLYLAGVQMMRILSAFPEACVTSIRLRGSKHEFGCLSG